jgi:chemotaxis protein CheZ
MTPRRKTFTIERDATSGHEPAPDAVPAGTRLTAADIGGVRQVLAKLDELGAMIQPTQAIVANIADAYRREVSEVLKLKAEMEAIQAAISETKRQVVSLHAAAPRAIKVNHAAGELGAVVIDTEGATHNILAAAESIEMLAGVIQSETTAQAMKQRAGDIAGVVMQIYEACNFQDLTGQRISRVCETLNFIESRVDRMAEIWGGLDSLSSVMEQEMEALNAEHRALGTHALAAGPAVVGAEGHVNQDDIDALFG